MTIHPTRGSMQDDCSLLSNDRAPNTDRSSLDSSLTFNIHGECIYVEGLCKTEGWLASGNQLTCSTHILFPQGVYSQIVSFIVGRPSNTGGVEIDKGTGGGVEIDKASEVRLYRSGADLGGGGGVRGGLFPGDLSVQTANT